MAQGRDFRIMGGVAFPGVASAWGPTAAFAWARGKRTDPGIGPGGFVSARITTPQAIAPIPGDLNPWSDVAKYVGIILPGKFAGPPPAPEERSYPGLTQHTAKKVGSKGPPYTIVNGETESFIHTFPASMIHAVDVTNPMYGHLSRLPSSWPSAIGETGTVVRIGENFVLTANHVWKRLEKASTEANSLVFVVFDFQDPGESPGTPTGSSDPSARDDGGWGRPVRQVGKVTGALFQGSKDESYALHEDWVILEVDWFSFAGIPDWDDPSDGNPYEVERMAETDWYNGRRRTAAGGKKPKFEKFDLDRLVLIGHPLGITKQFADGGSVLLANNNLFQHDLVTLTGNSGSPIFRSAIGNTAEIWLVGISLSGRDARDEPAAPYSADDASTPPCPPPLRAHENISLDIREVLRRVHDAGGFPTAYSALTSTPGANLPGVKCQLGKPPKSKFSTAFSSGTLHDPESRRILESRLAATKDATAATWTISTQKLVLDKTRKLPEFEAFVYRADATRDQLTRNIGFDTFEGTTEEGDIGILALLHDKLKSAIVEDGKPTEDERSISAFALHAATTGGAYAYVADTDKATAQLIQQRQDTEGFATSQSRALVFAYRRPQGKDIITDIKIVTRVLGHANTDEVVLKSNGPHTPWIGKIAEKHKPTWIRYSVDKGSTWSTIDLKLAETDLKEEVSYKNSSFSIEPNALDFTAPTDILITLGIGEIRNHPQQGTFTSFTSATVEAKADGESLTVAREFNPANPIVYSSCVVPPVSKETKITFTFTIKYKVKKGRAITNKTLTLTLDLTAKPA